MLKPDDGGGQPARRLIEHGRVEVGRDNLGVGQGAMQFFGDDASAGGRFKYPPRPPGSRPFGDQPGVGGEDQRYHILVVDRGDRAGENRIRRCHHSLHLCPALSRNGPASPRV